jgi:hypothetical protein
MRRRKVDLAEAASEMDAEQTRGVLSFWFGV